MQARIKIENLKTGEIFFKFIPSQKADKLKKYQYGLILKGNKITVEG